MKDSYICFLLASCPLLCLSGNQALNFFNGSPVKSNDRTTAYFEQFNSLGIKPIRPAIKQKQKQKTTTTTKAEVGF